VTPPIFGGREGGERSAAEREAARLERERRRAAREGRPPPDEPPADEPRADDRSPLAWDAPGEHDPHVSEPRPFQDDEEEPEHVAGDPVADQPAPEPDRVAGDPVAEEPEPERFADAAREPVREEPPFDDPADEPWADEPDELDEREEWDRPAADEPARAGWEAPTQQHDVPAAEGWSRGGGAADERWADGNGHDAGPAPDRDDDAARDEHDAAPARARANGAEDPQATQPFEPVGTAATRRTVSLPRPQTDTGEYDAPIGTVRVSRGAGAAGGGGGGGHYQAQPGASGYPPYRKLAVKPRRRWLRRIAAILALALAVAACAFTFLLFQPRHGSGSGNVVVTVPAGATAGQIGDLLADRGVVQSSFFFSLRARLSGDRSKLRSGRYTLRQGMSYGAALKALTTAPKAAPVVNITIPEGPSRREEAAKLRAAGLKGSYLAATKRSAKLDPRDYGAPRSTKSLEGFLFPSTYQLRASQATAKRLVNRQLDAFKEAFGQVSMRRAKARNLSRYDVLIIASMIEREALVPRDRRLIAAVIYNRLQQGIPLGIDATLRYALNQWSRPLRVSELNSGSRFNTRRRDGLPPTPIGNPGLAALKAAANPANVSYLFYVVRPCGDGAHAFSSTDAKFQQDVAKYNAARDRRGGKDPSHC
jgi:peptidoglycan lytic transglycosylase G